MSIKTLFKIDSNEFNRQYGVSEDDMDINQEIVSVRNNKIVTKRVTESGLDTSETTFERQDIADVVLCNIEIQFALFQFYMMYSAVENIKDRSNEKLCGQVCYPKMESKLSDLTLSNLLSIFDSVIVVYKKNKTNVQTTLSSLDTKMKIYNVYKRLYEESLLNPFIISFIDEKKGYELENASTSIFQYQPCEDDINIAVLNKEDMIFIHFIKQQLTLSNSFMFYCLGWNEDDVTRSMSLKKIAKYFNKIFFISTPDRFLSQLLIICN